MTKKKQKEDKAPKPEPRDYKSIRIWAGLQKWGPALLIETQERASKEGQPLDVVFYDHAAKKWWITSDIKSTEARRALGIPGIILVCPECGSGNVICTACDRVYQIRSDGDRQGMCEDDRCLGVAGALECGGSSCRKIVSFSGLGVIVIDPEGDKDSTVMRPWAEKAAT